MAKLVLLLIAAGIALVDFTTGITDYMALFETEQAAINELKTFVGQQTSTITTLTEQYQTAGADEKAKLEQRIKEESSKLCDSFGNLKSSNYKSFVYLIQAQPETAQMALADIATGGDLIKFKSEVSAVEQTGDSARAQNLLSLLGHLPEYGGFAQAQNATAEFEKTYCTGDANAYGLHGSAKRITVSFTAFAFVAVAFV